MYKILVALFDIRTRSEFTSRGFTSRGLSHLGGVRKSGKDTTGSRHIVNEKTV
jgi:hypothetical protein